MTISKSLSSPRALHGWHPRLSDPSPVVAPGDRRARFRLVFARRFSAQALCTEGVVTAGIPSRKGSASPRELCATLFSNKKFVNLHSNYLADWDSRGLSCRSCTSVSEFGHIYSDAEPREPHLEAGGWRLDYFVNASMEKHGRPAAKQIRKKMSLTHAMRKQG
jgi:hypothetical protein